MIRHGSILTIAALVLVLLGCGRRPSGGESLDAQYQRVLQTVDAETRVSQLLGVADKQHKAGDTSGTARSLASAADAARSVRDAGGRAVALNRVGMAAARMNQTAEAKSLLREVRKTAADLESVEAEVPLLARMAYTYGKYLGQSGEAADLLARAEAAAGEIARPEQRSEALLEVALTHFGLQQADAMQRLVDRALQDARGMGDPRRRADALANIGAALSRMKQADQAKAAFQEAQQTAVAIPDPLSQGYAYVHLGGRLSEAGLPGAAQKVLQIAENSADKVPDQTLRTPLLERIYAARKRI